MANGKKPLSLEQLYYQSGLLTFMLLFIPVIPGFVEAHVKAYLKTLSIANIKIDSVDQVIRTMFGERGVQAYKEYLDQNPEMILPDRIYDLIYHRREIDEALKLISRIFFDKRQRAFLISDRIRASILREIPHILEVFPEAEYQDFRTRLVQKMSSAAQMDTAILSRLAAITTAYTLLLSVSTIEQRRKEARFNAEMEMLSGKIKAELAGAASIYSAPVLSGLSLREMPSHLLTSEDIESLTQTLHLLVKSSAPEVKQAALDTIRKVNDLEIRYFFDVPSYYDLKRKRVIKATLAPAVVTDTFDALLK